VNHQELVAARFPKSRGARVGTVEQVLRASLVIEVESHTSLKRGDGVVFDEGHPDQDEQGGRVFAVRPRGKRLIEIELGRGDVNRSAISVGAIVWKTDDPALRKRLEHSFSRDTVARRSRLTATVRAHVGQSLSIRFNDGVEQVEVTWDKPLERALKFPLDESVVREQLSRLGDTPYELAELTLDSSGGPMVPKSVLNDLRRQAVKRLLELRHDSRPSTFERPNGLDELRALLPLPPGEGGGEGPDDENVSAHRDPSDPPALILTLSRREREQGSARLYVLTRTNEQLQAVLLWESDARPAMVYCDFEDIRRYKDAVALARAAGVPIALATLRIVKPHEHGLLQQILECRPDAVLIRNLAAVSFYREVAPDLPQIGDYALNIANELTAGIFADTGLVRMVPSYDLNWRQLAAMLGRFDPTRFECVVHQHMPMFHMEHCVFAHTLSSGKDYHDCGRPCERHRVDLRDRVGQPHPLIPDVGCRNTVFNAQAQSAAEYIPKMLELGIRHFRVELLREKSHEVAPLLERYASVIHCKSKPNTVLRSLRVLNQFGVTRGTLDRE
jgi:putative protease